MTLKTAGSQSITATDTSTPAITGTLSGISVSPAAASQLVVSGPAVEPLRACGQTFTVTAKDPYGNVATGYTGPFSLHQHRYAGQPAGELFLHFR